MAKGPIKAKIKKGKKGQIPLKGISGIAIKPTVQDIKIAEGLAKGLGKIEALKEAGIAETNARSNSATLTNTPGVNKALQEALGRAQVGIDRIAQTIDEGLNATKVVTVTKNNEVVLFPDYPERRQTARFASELMGLMVKDGPAGNGMDPEEEGALIASAEAKAQQRDVTKFVVIHERN